MKKILAQILLTILVSLSMGMSTYAYDYKPTIIPKPDLVPGPTKDQIEMENIDGSPNSIRSILIERILPRYTIAFIGLIGGVALLMAIIGGVRFATFYGDEEAIKKARDQIIYSLLGFLIAILAYTIVTIISNIRIENDTTVNPAQPANPTQQTQ